METELWHNLLLQCSRLGIPIAVANARISDRSYPRYQRLRALWSPLLRRVSLFAAQSSLDAARLRELGANNVAVFGNLKFDVRTDPASSALVSQLRTALPANAPILICGSTLAGEEDDLLDCLPALHAVAPGLICILAPRHPERFAAVADLLTHRGLSFTRRSQWNGASIAPASIFLLDSVGDLAALYSIATVAFVGGSLFTGGGHNPLEPAQFAIPIVMGDSFENFRDIIRAMLASQAIIVTPRKHLCANLTALLSDSSRAAALGLAAQRVYLAEAGATARTVAALLPMLAQKGSEQ